MVQICHAPALSLAGPAEGKGTRRKRQAKGVRVAKGDAEIGGLSSDAQKEVCLGLKREIPPTNHDFKLSLMCHFHGLRVHLQSKFSSSSFSYNCAFPRQP